MGKKWLDIVYNEKSSIKLKQHYKSWADDYDRDLVDWGYAYPSQLKKIMSQDIKIKKNSKILDAGCGTGLVAEVLGDMNFKNIVGLDYSIDMLKIAKDKKIYTRLIQESLNKKTSLRCNQFDIVLCTGVLTSGHVGAKAINELIRVTKNKGYLILSIAESIYEKLGFKDEIEKNKEQISKIKISNPFIALPNHKSSATSRMHIYQKKLS
ncbi:MAG: class I SAM-dependent methyltransferase [Pelagibacterales bacterium]|nr:class I SAM-dependent methyltransferase [Pelagibacterales bacterium]